MPESVFFAPSLRVQNAVHPRIGTLDYMLKQAKEEE